VGSQRVHWVGLGRPSGQVMQCGTYGPQSTDAKLRVGLEERQQSGTGPRSGRGCMGWVGLGSVGLGWARSGWARSGWCLHDLLPKPPLACAVRGCAAL